MSTTELRAPAGAPAAPAPPPPPRRMARRRMSLGHVVMVLAALLAMVANLAVLQAGDDTVEILVAADGLRAGERLDVSRVRAASARLDGGVLASLLRPGHVGGGDYDGWVAVSDVPAGSVVRLADLRAPASDVTDERRISIPLAPERAVGGAVTRGATVDVIETTPAGARYLVAGARVLDVAESGSGIGGLGRFFVTIGVDPSTALCLAAAIDGGDLTLVVSTGQPPVPVTPCTPAAGGR